MCVREYLGLHQFSSIVFHYGLTALHPLIIIHNSLTVSVLRLLMWDHIIHSNILFIHDEDEIQVINNICRWFTCFILVHINIFIFNLMLRLRSILYELIYYNKMVLQVHDAALLVKQKRSRLATKSVRLPNFYNIILVTEKHSERCFQLDTSLTLKKVIYVYPCLKWCDYNMFPKLYNYN